MTQSKTGPSRAETVQFVAGLLAKNSAMKPNDVKKAAKAKGFHVYPLIFGLARKELGIAPKAPTGRGPGRPRKTAVAAPVAAKKTVAAASTSADGAINGIIAHMRSLDAELARLRGLLEQISNLAAK